MEHIYDKSNTIALFGLDRFSNYSEADEERLSKQASSLVAEFGEQIVFDEWLDYLKASVSDRTEAWNFMMNFFAYGGYELKVKDPYPFLGLLFRKLGLSLEVEPVSDDEKQMFSTFDSIYASLITKAGFVSEDDYFLINPYQDKRLKIAIEQQH